MEPPVRRFSQHLVTACTPGGQQWWPSPVRLLSL